MDQKTNPQPQPRPTPKRKLSAIMFTDMTGFSRKMGESERLTLKLLRDHNRIIRFLVRKHHGKMIKSTGDGFLLDFDSAVEAVQCALEAQERFQRYNLNKPETEQIVVRIGINLGEIRIIESDLFGDEVNIAARLQTLAEPGGICISRDVYEHVKSKLAIFTVNLGPQQLKNIRHEMQVYKVFVPTIGEEAIEIPTMNLSLLAMAERANGSNGRKPAPERANFSRLLAIFKKNPTPAVSARPMEPRQSAHAKLLLKAVPMVLLMLPATWLASRTGESGLTSSVAAMSQWFSGTSYARPQTPPLDTAQKRWSFYILKIAPKIRDNWMSIGLADILITDSGVVPGGHVLGRTRLMDTLKQLGKENVQSMDLPLARAVAKQANADIMLLGTIMRDGKTLRIDTQLYDVRQGEILLAEKAQGENVLKLVDELAHRLKKQMAPW
jgi:class 3 adenylate cyclase/TolB-like protein